VTNDATKRLQLELQRSVLDKLNPLVRLSAVVLVFYVALAHYGHHLKAGQVVLALLGLGLSVGIHPRWSQRVRAAGMVVVPILLSIIAVATYGPLLGLGTLLAVTNLSASFFYGTRGAVATTVVLMLTVAGVALGTWAGVLQPEFYASGVQWFRAILTVGICLASVTYMANRHEELTEKAIAQQVAAVEEQRAATEERARLQSRVAASQKLESLGRLAGGVAHDFSNALSVVLAGVQALRDPAHAADHASILDDIEQSAQGASSTARHLLAFSRGNPQEPGQCDPAQLLERFASGIRRMLPESITVTTRAGGGGRIGLSEKQLEQVVLNLVINARDAMPRGGTITLASRVDGDRVVIEVADQGVGMDEVTLSRVFEPFFSTKGELGTGLGLAMVWGTVTGVGGQIDVRSRPGEGSTFQLAFPRLTAEKVASDPPRRATGRPNAAAPARAGLRVLLLEDEPAVRRVFERSLGKAGYEVSSHAVASSAIEAVAGQSFELLVTDAVVPGGRVADLIKAFRAANAGGRVVICSGHVQDQVVLDGIQRDEYRFLPKPFTVDGFLAVVAEEVAPRAAVTP